jgi:glycosyltransferase involved in cell wall biosynthesis
MKSLVSCLMVTLPTPYRVPGFKFSVDDFLRQSHPKKELVIVMNGGDAATQRLIRSYVSNLQRPEIRLVERAGLLTLGALRNVSVAEAHGDYFCQWDDDDRHHPQRLESQLQYLRTSGKRAICLEEVMQYFPDERSLFCINWRATEATSFPGTLFSEKSVDILYPESGEMADRGEDSVVVRQLMNADEFHVLPTAPYLYLYVSHGQNTWSQDHHRFLAQKLSLSKGLLMRREAKLREGLQPFSDYLSSAVVRGFNGAAFTL